MKIVRISAIWCSSCIVTFHAWEKVKENHEDIPFLELDYDMDDIESYDVKEILPVTIFYENEKEIARIEGEFKESDVERVINREKVDN